MKLSFLIIALLWKNGFCLYHEADATLPSYLAWVASRWHLNDSASNDGELCWRNNPNYLSFPLEAQIADRENVKELTRHWL